MVLPILSLASCASIVSKSNYPVAFKSDKPVKITVTNQSTNNVVYSGTAPTTANLPASNGYFKPAKYDITTSKGVQNLNASLDPWYAGNIVFGGAIGALVDPATGAMWKLPKEVTLSH